MTNSEGNGSGEAQEEEALWQEWNRRKDDKENEED